MMIFGRYFVTGNSFGSDGMRYFFILRSLALDHDLDMYNESEHFKSEVSKFTGNQKISWFHPKNEITGRYTPYYQMGMGLYLLPFFYASHLVALTASRIGFAVDIDSLNEKNIKITHKNLNDNTLEGFRHCELQIFDVQYHPEASHGPHDSRYLFDEFKNMITP